MIKVQIAEDLPPIRQQYVNDLQVYPDISVIAATDTMQSTVDAALQLHPDVILMDIEMDYRNAGIMASKLILTSSPDTKIIILTVYEEDRDVFSAFQIGVCDYILKNSSVNEIHSAIIDAYHENSPIRPVIATKIRSEFKRMKETEYSLLLSINRLSSLTSSEVETLKLLMKGYSRSEICELRVIEESTIKSQIRSLLRKFEKKRVVQIIEEIQDLHLEEYIDRL